MHRMQQQLGGTVSRPLRWHDVLAAFEAHLAAGDSRELRATLVRARRAGEGVYRVSLGGDARPATLSLKNRAV